MPFTMSAFTVASLSMIGIPPLGGFLSKWFLAIGSIEAEQIPIIIVLATSSILNASYFLPIVHAAFFKEPHHAKHQSPKPKQNMLEAPALVLVPLMITAIGTLVLFLWPSLFLDLARIVVAGVTGEN
jgi:multicomponent Na+:H+ antiporter subunit D